MPANLVQQLTIDREATFQSAIQHAFTLPVHDLRGSEQKLEGKGEKEKEKKKKRRKKGGGGGGSVRGPRGVEKG